jgi:hypothetical protein
MGAVQAPGRRIHLNGQMVRRGLAVAMLASSVPLLVLAAESGHGYSASQQMTPPINQSVGSGNVEVAISKPGPLSSVTVGAANLAPGSTVQRTVTIENTGTAPFGSLSMSMSISPGDSPLVTSGGVIASADYCPAGWKASAVGSGWTYSCPTAPTSILDPVPLSSAGSTMALPPPFSTLSPGGSATMRVTVEIPASDGNAIEKASMAINYRFAATQAVAS